MMSRIAEQQAKWERLQREAAQVLVVKLREAGVQAWGSERGYGDSVLVHIDGEAFVFTPVLLVGDIGQRLAEEGFEKP